MRCSCYNAPAVHTPPVSAPAPLPSRTRCWLLGAAGILILSPDALLLRLAHSEPFATAALRAMFATLAIAVLVVLQPALRRGFRWRPVFLWGLCYAVGLACFPLSIKSTHVANTVVIISAAPMLAAVGAYFILRERTPVVTWLAALLVVVGMAGVFAGSLGADGLRGDVLALLVALSLAATSIVVRKYPQTAVYPGLIVGGLIISVTYGISAEWHTVSARDVAILALDGAVVMTLSFLLLIAAARGLPPAEWNLLFLFETLLAPLWVWWVLGEAPPRTTVAAGALIIAVLTMHALWWLRKPPAQHSG